MTVIDTPEGINAWVMLSRISQCHLHMDGLRVPLLASWLTQNIPAEFRDGSEKTVKALYPRLLDWCDTLGIEAPGGERCNYQVLVTPNALNGLFFDKGIFDSMDAVTAFVTENVGMDAYNAGRVVIMRTMAPVRQADRSIQMVKG